MIVSHEYKFIFIKTHKVGGTSIEYALDRFAGEGGIVTPFSVRIDEQERRPRDGRPAGAERVGHRYLDADRA